MLPGKKYTPVDFLEMFRRRVWLIVVPPLVTAFVALLYSSTIRNLYQSDMLITIVPQRVPDNFVQSTVTLRTAERLDELSVQVTSRTNLEQIIREFHLYPDAQSNLPMEDVVAQMRSAVEVELERPRMGPRGPEPEHAFHVRFKYRDPNMAAQVTQRLGSLFVDMNARDRGALAGATEQFLGTKLAEARVRLEAQERRLEAYRQRHGNELPTQMQANLQVIQSTQVQIQGLVESIARDRDRKMMLERLYREAQNEPAPTPALVPQSSPTDVPVIATTEQQLATARAALAALERRFRPEHPDVIRAKREIAELERKAVAEASTPSESPAALVVTTPDESARRERTRQMAAEIESLDRQTQFKQTEEGRLRGVVAEYQRRVEAVPGIESEWASLTRDYDTLQAAYRDLLSKSEASKVAVDLEERQISEQFRIVDPAGVPVRPMVSTRGRINATGLAIGLLIGLGVAAFFELRDASFRVERDVIETLSAPVLAVVPHVTTSQELSRRRITRLATTCVVLLSLLGAGYAFWALKLWTSIL
jgi:protein tyrosine kinase modulator